MGLLRFIHRPAFLKKKKKKIREHNVSENGSVSDHRWGGGGRETITLLGPLES
jgi:hypothetical protein